MNAKFNELKLSMIQGMNKTKMILSLGVIAVTLSCKKEKDPEPNPTPTPVVKDCETNNYGIVTVDFSSNLVAHSIILTYPDFTFREKIIPIGTISDTVRIKTGSYTLALSSLNALGLLIDDSTSTGSITKCQETMIDINF